LLPARRRHRRAAPTCSTCCGTVVARAKTSEVYLKRGPRAREFETGRIVSWRLGKEEAGYLLVSSAAAGWLGARYELVVVFAANDTVQRHPLVEVRAQ